MEKDDSDSSTNEGEDDVDEPDRPGAMDMGPGTSRADRFFKFLTNPMRKAVSQNRRRMTNDKDKLNLDLTYITDRIIALGYPAEDFEMLYRNTMADTQRFLNGAHASKYMVFNLRGRFSYNPQKFENRVISFEMTDHHPPKLEYMAQFCREAHDFLEKDRRNVIAVHCKAGKGRTGVMICAYLVYIGFYPKPRSIMDYYSIIRTTNNKGVTIPSQRRYIYYFHHLRQNQLNYLPLRVELVGIYIECPKENGAKDLSLRVTLGDAIVYMGGKVKAPYNWGHEYAHWKNTRRDDVESIDFSTEYWKNETVPGRKDKKKNVISRRAFGWTVPSNQRVFIEGDVRVDFLHESTLGKEKLGHIWFNTMFVCPGYCQTHYIHGDEDDPYPDGLTSISERKVDCVQPRPKTGSASEPPTRPVTESTRGSDSGDSEQASTSRGDGSSRKKSKDDKKHASWRDTFQIIEPPALTTHCPESSLHLIHPSGAKRELIREMLIEAHEHDLVKDYYHERRNRINDKGPLAEVVKAADCIERPLAGGPCFIRRKPDEHVQCYPVYEIDRATKKKTLPEECKVFIVTKCIDPTSQEDRSLAAAYVKFSEEAQKTRDHQRAERKRKNTAVEPSTSFTYSKYCEPGTADDERSSDKDLSRFFTRQRENSPSRYPPVNFRCPLFPVIPDEPLSPSTSSYVVDSAFSLEAQQQVETYHPERTRDEDCRCETSGSSTTSTSSEEVNEVNGID